MYQRKVANDLKVHLSISELEIKAIFSTIRDAETNQVSFELLSELISKLEKVYLKKKKKIILLGNFQLLQ